jgi:hypothetical protein
LGRKEDPIDAAIVAAVERGVGPGADGFGDEVVAADEALSVYVKGLLSAVGVDVSREGGQESSPSTARCLAEAAVDHGDAVVGEQVRCGEVVPEGVSGEVGRVQWIPVQVAADSIAPEEPRTRVCSDIDQLTATGFYPRLTTANTPCWPMCGKS